MDVDRDAIIDADEMLMVDPRGWQREAQPWMAGAGGASGDGEAANGARETWRMDRALLGDDDSE